MAELNLKDVKANPEIFEETAEERAEILKRAGCGNLIDLMRCKNCLSQGDKEGKFWCMEEKKETKPDNTCPYWSEKIKQNELKEVYEKIKEVLKYYIDMKENDYEIVTLWIMGTWMHDQFPTFPYLFVHAIKGGGKTRLLKLIKELSWKGDMLASLSEAVLFRTTGTLCIDEFESMGNKDKNTLRELLNTAYKKGGKVKRMRKVKGKQEVGEDGRVKFVEAQEVEEFSTYRPLVIANISGMDEVLADRCIKIILEKSSTYTITRKVEDFENDPVIEEIKRFWANLVYVGVVYVGQKTMYRDWNIYIHTLTYTPTLTTLTYTPTLTLFEKIYKTNIDGRNLELTLPLILIAERLGLVDKFIEIAKEITESKREEDVTESRDMMLFDLISRQTPSEWYKVNSLTGIFKQFINYEPDDETRNWLTNTWMGRALRRLNLVLKNRRLSEGVEVILDTEKAKSKLLIFK